MPLVNVRYSDLCQRDQYKVVMKMAPEYWRRPQTIDAIKVRTAEGAMVPLNIFKLPTPPTPRFPSTTQASFTAGMTLSFNLAAVWCS